jgi:transposase-like protein
VPETMIPIIKKVVRAGTTIHTDEWKTYNPLTASEDFKHKKITHRYNFVDPITGVHTQNVESFNNKIKKDIKAQMGVRSSHRPIF